MRIKLIEIQRDVSFKGLGFFPAYLFRSGNFDPNGCVCIYFNCKYPLWIDSC